MNIRQTLEQTVFNDSYCEFCRCGPMHHNVDSESRVEMRALLVRVYCKYHKKLCYEHAFDNVMGLQDRGLLR